jgi:hypothetical protein
MHIYVHIICPWLVHKTTNVPVVYMGLVLSGFDGGISITRGILGPPPPKMPLVMDSPPSNPLRTAPYKQQVH